MQLSNAVSALKIRARSGFEENRLEAQSTGLNKNLPSHSHMLT